MKKANIMVTACALLIFNLNGCKVVMEDTPEPSKVPEEYALDHLKFLHPGVTSPFDKSTFQQPTFTVKSNHHLLMLMTSLSSHTGKIIISKEHPFLLVITPANPEDAKRENLSLCSVQRDWMMGATWTHAHIFDKTKGQWQSTGGDFGDCHPPLKPVEGATQITFDVTDWYQFAVKSKNQNFGLALKSEEPITLYGDKSLYGPRYRWTISGVN